MRDVLILSINLYKDGHSAFLKKTRQMGTEI